MSQAAIISESESNALDTWLKPFEELDPNMKAPEPSWLYPLRKSGISRFSELGFPTTKDEDWRFTGLQPALSIPFRPGLQAISRPIDGPNPTGIADPVDAWTLAFLDGRFIESWSRIPGPGEGFEMLSLSKAMESDHPAIKGLLAERMSDEKNAFEALNLAYFTDGALIIVSPGQVVQRPVHLKFVSTSDTRGMAQHLKNFIVCGANSRCTVIESYLSVGDSPHTTNVTSELQVGQGAFLEFCKIQDEDRHGAFHFASIHAHMQRDSHTRIHSMDLGGRISRNNIHAKLDGEGLTCVLNGLYLAKDQQLSDHHMIVEHAKPRCESHEYFNGILDDQSRGVFHGRIFVHQIAQKTDAKQTNKNLLLSDQATANAKPQLEIYADDVKCTHGATIGQMNDEAIFYLQSRGIGSEQARRMLIHSFASEIIDRVGCEPLKDRLDAVVWDRLEQYSNLK